MEDLDQGYDDERFVNVVDEDLHCAICLNVLKQPVQCQNNEHYFCTPCIRRHLKNFRACPSCMEELTLETLRKPARYLTKHLSKLIIQCDYVNRGCGEVIELEDLKTHVNTCGFAPVTCSNDGCGVLLNKHEQAHHENEVCYFGKVSRADYNALKKERDQMKTRLDELKDKFCQVMVEKSGIKVLEANVQDQTVKSKIADIIIVGGREGFSTRHNSVETFIWSTRRWESLQSMKETRSAGSSVFYENQMIVVGGYNGDICLKSIEAFNMNQNPTRWSNFPAGLTKKTGAHQSVIYKDRLFVIGGTDFKTNVYKDIYEIFLQAPHSSRMKCNMVLERSYHGATLVGNKVVIVGGITKGKYSIDSVEIYDIRKNECKQMPPLPFAWSKMATVSWGDNVVVTGGEDKSGQCLNTVLMYNLKGEIKMLPPMKYKRAGCSAVISGNLMVVMGGYNERQSFLSSVECFSFDRYLWEELPPMIKPRIFAAAVVKSDVESW